MPTLTTANSIITLTIAGLFSSPQTLQGYSADDVFDTESVAPTETSQGVDGKLSGGFVYVPTKQGYVLQADSASVALFEQWDAAQKAALDALIASGSIALPSLGTKYAMSQGFLTMMPRTPSAKKLMQPRKFEITWGDISPAPN